MAFKYLNCIQDDTLRVILKRRQILFLPRYPAYYLLIYSITYFKQSFFKEKQDEVFYHSHSALKPLKTSFFDKIMTYNCWPTEKNYFGTIFSESTTQQLKITTKKFLIAYN